MGIMVDRTSFRALCKLTAKLNLTPSSAILIIILGKPTVLRVIRRGDSPNPSGAVMRSMAASTLG